MRSGDGCVRLCWFSATLPGQGESAGVASHRRRRCARQRGEQIARLIRSGFRVPRIPCEAIFLVYVVGVAVKRSLRVGAALRCHSICFVSEALTASYRRCRRAMHRSKKIARLIRSGFRVPQRPCQAITSVAVPEQLLLWQSLQPCSGRIDHDSSQNICWVHCPSKTQGAWKSCLNSRRPNSPGQRLNSPEPFCPSFGQ